MHQGTYEEHTSQLSLCVGNVKNGYKKLLNVKIKKFKMTLHTILLLASKTITKYYLNYNQILVRFIQIYGIPKFRPIRGILKLLFLAVFVLNCLGYFLNPIHSYIYE